MEVGSSTTLLFPTDGGRCSLLVLPRRRLRSSSSKRCSFPVGQRRWQQQQQQQQGRGFLLTTTIAPPRCQKMFVPGFAEASPEAKAAKNLQHFFTFLAVKIVLAQLQSYNPEAYQELMEFIGRHSLNDGEKFCGSLMRESPRHQALALRILEVRSAYLKQDFEWDNLKKLAFKIVDESNTRIMRDYILETSHIEDEN